MVDGYVIVTVSVRIESCACGNMNVRTCMRTGVVCDVHVFVFVFVFVVMLCVSVCVSVCVIV